VREASLYHFAVHGTPGTAELQPLRELLRGNAGGPSQFVQYGMVMLAAEKRLRERDADGWPHRPQAELPLARTPAGGQSSMPNGPRIRTAAAPTVQTAKPGLKEGLP